MAVTLKTVAERTRLSPGAVSRILNFKEKEIRINEQTAERVRRTAKRMGYIRNPQARNLRLNISNIIGVVIQFPESSNDLIYKLFKGISKTTSEAGKTLMLYDVGTIKEYQQGVDCLLEHRAEGIITTQSGDPQQKKIIKDIYDKGIKIVIVNNNEKDSICPYINGNHELGGFKATEHLIKLGHRRIAHISNNVNTSVGCEQYQGYCRALKQYKIKKDNAIIIDAEKGNKAEKVVQAMLNLKNKPTAIFAWNDSTALAAQKMITEAGLKVPDDIALIGFDNRDFSQLDTVSLSTVTYPMLKIGQQAVKAITNGDESYKNYLIEPELIVRKSSGGKI